MAVHLEPTVVTAGRTTTVQVHGTNTRFDEETFEARFFTADGVEDPDLVIRQQRVDSPLQARFELGVDRVARAGTRDVEIRSGNRTLDATLEVRAITPEPRLSLRPGSGPAGAVRMRLFLDGVGTCFGMGTTTLRFFPEDGGISVDSFDTDDATSARARVSIAAGAPGGEHSAVVEDPCGVVSARFVVVSDLGPRIEVEPDSAFPGETVGISVRGFDGTSFEPGVTSVEVENPDVAVERLDVTAPDQLSATLVIDALAATGPTELRTVTGESIQRAAFTIRLVEGDPFVRILPNHVYRGERAYVWVEGVRTDFAADLSASLVDGRGDLRLHGAWRVGPTDAVLDLEADPDAELGTARVDVTSGGDALRGELSVLRHPDGSISVDPAVLAPGERALSLTITGNRTSFRAGHTAVAFSKASGVSITSMETVGPTEIRLDVDVSPTAPGGPVELEVTGGMLPLRARLEVDSPARLDVVPPALRAGVGDATITLSGAGLAPPGPGARARIYVPEAEVLTPVAGGDESVDVPVRIGPGATPRPIAIAYASGEFSAAAPLAVLPRPVPLLEPSQPTVEAGQEALIGLSTVDTSLIQSVTTVRGRWVRTAGFFGADLFVLLAVPSDARPGPTGFVVTTHGEIAACVVNVLVPDAPATAVAEDSVVPFGSSRPVTIHGIGTHFEPGVTTASLPGGFGVRVEGLRVEGAEDLTLDVTAEGEGEAFAGTYPLTVRTDLELVQLPVSVVEVDPEPILLIDPMQVEPGETTTLRGLVLNMVLDGPVTVEVEGEDVEISDHRVLSDSEVRIDVSPSVEARGLHWLTVGSGEHSARALLFVREGAARIEGPPERITRGRGLRDISWDAPLATMSPGDTVARFVPLDARLRVGRVAPSAPEQVNLSLEALPPGPDMAAGILLVTDDQVVVGPLDVRTDDAAGLSRSGTAGGDALPGSPALFLLGGEGQTWIDVLLGDGPTSLEILSSDGATVLDGPATLGHQLLSGDDAPFVRVTATDDVGGPFSLATMGLDHGAQSELEPNREVLLAERLGDPSVRPALLRGALGGADVDLLRVDASIPAAVEVLAGKVGPAWSVPLLSLQPVDEGGVALGEAAIGLDAIIETGVDETSYFALSALEGSLGPYLASLRAAVVVSEVAPVGGANAFVELRGVPGMSLEGWSLELADDGGADLGMLDLAGVEVPGDGLVVVGVAAGPVVDSVLAAVGSLAASGGIVRLRFEGSQADALAWGRARGGEGSAAAAPGAGASLARPYGIDRDDNRADFVATSPPSPGGPNR